MTFLAPHPDPRMMEILSLSRGTFGSVENLYSPNFVSLNVPNQFTI